MSAYANEITFNSQAPSWFNFDCNATLPTSYYQIKPDGFSFFKYFSAYTNHKCYAVMETVDMSGMTNISNATVMNMTIDTRGSVISHQILSNHYSVNCDLLYFNNTSIVNGIITQTPQVFNSTSCTDSPTGARVEHVITFTPSQVSEVEASLNAGNNNQMFMLLPHFNATMQSSLDSSGYEFGIEKQGLAYYINGNGFNCELIQGSGFCNFLNKPWAANEIAFGKEIFGPWFYVIVFFPFPMVVYLITRNGVYAGFMGLAIMLVINTISPMIFEISLTMIAIAAAFAFYEVIRKRLLEG